MFKDDGTLALDKEEFPRPGTKLEGLSKLGASFAQMADMPLDDKGTTLRSLVLGAVVVDLAKVLAVWFLFVRGRGNPG